MNWLSPNAAWWLLLLPALLALYLFRPRSLRKPVPSLRLWEKLPQVDRPRARLRRPPLSLLLLLQLLLLTAGAIALIRPALETPVGRHYVLLLDASGSMMATSGDSTRFEQARAEARKVASDMRPLDRATLLRVGTGVTTACSGCGEADLERALSQVKPGAGQADMSAALSLAAGLAGRTPDDTLEVIVISDGGFPPQRDLADNTQYAIRNITVGEAMSNRAITVLSARRPPDGRPGYVAYARVDNGGSLEATVEVSALADTVPLPTRNVTLAPGGHADLTWQLPAGAARFTVSLSGRDAIQADDRAVILLPSAGRHKVSIISPQTDLYRRALSGIEGLEPVVVTTNTLATSVAPAAFSIIEGSVPLTLPNGSLLLVNPTGDLFPTKGEVSDLRPVGGAAHPVVSGLDLSPLLVDTAQQVEAPTWLEPVLLSDIGTPLIVAGEREGKRVVALLFDPNRSNLPKLAAFPLLMSNVVDWLFPLASAGALQPGDPIYLAPGMNLTTPGGAQLQVGPSGILNDTEEAGIYTVTTPEGADETGSPTQFSVNMANLAESTTNPTRHPELDTPQFAIRNSQQFERVTQQEIWSPLAAFALFLVGAEWLFYCWKRGRL